MSRRWRGALRHQTFVVGLAITAAILLVAGLSLVYTPRDPLQMDIAARLQAPSAAYPLGTDQFGRDLLSRVMRGAVASLVVGAVAVGIGMGLGVVLGMLGGYFGGWLDEGLMRLMDAVYGFPAVLSALLVTAVFGPGAVISMVAVGTASVPIFARLTRGSFLALREREFVVAARALGARDLTIITRHILPNTLSPLVVQATISFPIAILAEAALSYLGLGTQPPHPSWGLMLKDAQNFLTLSPWYALFPGTAIALAVLGFNLLGDGLRDVLDPRAW
ncbi:MAG TPA: ABC transporter permease [Methylomirabilota bacterium]|jgi:peptide/nickel transport system permease protein|nr:ABC transporter permease [Methylomirabilota bacterium]